MAKNFIKMVKDSLSGAGETVRNYNSARKSNNKSSKNIEEYVRKRMQKENAGRKGKQEAQKEYSRRVKAEKKRIGV